MAQSLEESLERRQGMYGHLSAIGCLEMSNNVSPN
jgi:hypothetical protein